MARQKVKRDFTYKRKHYPSTPFTEWLHDYCHSHQIPVVEMSLRAGLSRGALNNYISNPRRKPEPGTILKLANFTGKPAAEIAKLAGVPGYGTGMTMEGSSDPSIEKLVEVYKRLPIPMQHYVLRSAYALDEALQSLKPQSSQVKKRR
jgi:hypothetical protein